ncbi:MAG TPA: efflux RND transporter periplasmic adaptor subunit [Xanthobacteraceae bacterium]
MKRALRRIVLLACLGLMVWATYWYFGPLQPAQQQQAKQQAQPKGPGGFRRGGGNPNDTVPVLASAARLADVPVYLDGVGTAKALNTVLVRPQVDGKLMKIMFTEGHEVTQGSVIAKIDPTTFQAAYDIAVAKKEQDEALLANAQLDLDRYTKLAATNAIQKQQLDTTKSLVNQYMAQTHSDQAAIDNAKAILDYTDVVAPITGLTGIRQVDEGNIVHASDTTGIVTITQIKPIAVLFNLPQQNLPDLNKGMAESVLQVQALGGADGTTVVDTGKVVVINNQVDQTTGTVQIKAEFPNANVLLWPGQFINVRVLINTLRQVVVVPTAAVQRGPDGTFVYVIKDDNTAGMRPITVSKQDDLQAVISTGVQAGDRVVTTGFGRLADGSKVVATSAEEAGQVSTDPTRRPGAGAGAPKGKGQRQQGATADAPGNAPPGATTPGAATTDPTQPPRRRESGARKGNEPPAGSAGPPSPAPGTTPSTTP